MSVEGANAYAILLSIYTTCRLRGISFPRYLKASLKHHIRTGKPLSIEAYSRSIHPDFDMDKASCLIQPQSVISHGNLSEFSLCLPSLHRLYAHHYDFFYHLEDIVDTATRMWLARSPELKALDASREIDPYWFQSNRMLRAMCYVDLFAGNFAGLRERIPYLTELGITYPHLMPLFKTPEGDNDCGYAVSSYREVDPALGTMEELATLATELRHHGINLCLDFVFNHTSDEHTWAIRALAGDPVFQEYYRMYPVQANPETGNARISGTTASLCGLESALQQNDAQEKDFANRRILLLHGIIMTIGGIPLVYLGDELGMLYDYEYIDLETDIRTSVII